MSFTIQKVTYPPMQRWMREGKKHALSFAPIAGYPNTRATVTAGNFTTINGGATFAVELGRSYVMRAAKMWADQDCPVAVQYGQSAYSGAISESYSEFGGTPSGGGEARWAWEDGLLIPEDTFFSFGYTPPTASAPFTSGSAALYSITADFNYDAQFVILFVGDSITFAQIAGSNGTAGMNGNSGFPMMIRNHLLNRGIDVRHVNKGFSGMTSPQSLVKINDNYFYHCVEERERVCLVIDAMGMNDAQSPATSQANVNAYQNGLLTLLDYYRNAELVSMSMTGTNDSAGGRVANAATIRGYKSSWVSSLTGSYASRTHFADGTLAYGGSGGAGSAIAADGSISNTYLADNSIHPNIAGHAAIVANVLGPAIARTNWGSRVLGGTW